MKLKYATKVYTRQFPELALIEDLDKRNEVVSEASRHLVLPQFIIGLLQNMVIIFFVFNRLAVLDGKYYYLPSIVCITFLARLFAPLPFAIRGKKFRRTLRERINEFGAPICLECGYQLKGLAKPRCPECGNSFRPFENEDINSDLPA
ncbi:MAG: hypothetical protein GXP29_11015 [Planctomycetes bacterium]|nr:hypothetical protein [Planctomycetota bacterium]